MEKKDISQKVVKKKKCWNIDNNSDDCDSDSYEIYETDSDDSDSYETDETDSNENMEYCFRCGRKGHNSSSCYASKHIKGYYLYLKKSK